MDFDSLRAAGTMAGSGGVIVMDDTTCMVEALESGAKFFADESCGQCSPCREGTGWVLRIVHSILSKLRQLDPSGCWEIDGITRIVFGRR